MLESNEMMSILPVTPNQAKADFFSQQPVAPKLVEGGSTPLLSLPAAAGEGFRSQLPIVSGVAPKDV